MPDDKTHRLSGSDKTVILPRSGDADRKTEVYAPHQKAGPMHGGQGGGMEDTHLIGGQRHQGAGGYAQPAQGSPGTVRMTPQTPGGGAAPAGSPEAGYTRVLRPSIEAGQEPPTAGKTPGGGLLAAGELALLHKEGPVVGWLVVIKGPGKGLARPIYYGNNTVGRDSSQRIPLNFGDDAISAAEQAYIRYDSEDRRFLLLPNLAKSNLVSVNGGRPLEAVALSLGDVIGMGQTQIMFIPLCGPEFDWADIEGQ